MNEVYICGYKRTPIGSYLGKLKDVTAPNLAATVIRHVIEDLKITPSGIDEVIMGNVLSSGIGQAPARQAALYANLSYSTQCMTINKVCGSGLKSVLLANQAIKLGDSNIIFAGGMENMSQAPFLVKDTRTGMKFGNTNMVDSILHDGLWDPYNNVAMGSCAEELNKEEKFSREEQDDYATESYKKANFAIENGIFDKEIVPIIIKNKKGDLQVRVDEEPLKFNEEKIKLLKPAFNKEGSITAANASSLNDGAAVILVASQRKSEELGLKPIARIIAHCSFAMEPVNFTRAPIYAIQKVVEKAKLNISDIDLFEINEAFSCVPLVAMKELKLPYEKVNIYGGAVSMGHPIGASGARILVTLLNALEQENKKLGLASICIGGGEASAIIIERL